MRRADDADRVRPAQQHAVPGRGRGEPPLGGVLADFGEPRAEDDRRGHAELAALLHHVQAARRRDSHAGQVDPLPGQLGEVGHRGVAVDGRRRRVHDVHPALVAELPQVAQHGVARQPGAGRAGPDDQDRGRLQQRRKVRGGWAGRRRLRRGLRLRPRLRGPDDRAGVDGDRAALVGQNRVQVDLGEVGVSFEQGRGAADQLGHRVQRARGPAVASQDPAHRYFEQHGPRPVHRHRRGAQRHRRQQLDQAPAGSDHHHRAEDSIALEADEDLGVAGRHHLLDQQPPLAQAEPGRQRDEVGRGRAHLARLGQAQAHAADVALVHQVRADQLQRHGPGHRGGGGHRRRGVRAQRLRGLAHPGGSQPGGEFGGVQQHGQCSALR